MGYFDNLNSGGLFQSGRVVSMTPNGSAPQSMSSGAAPAAGGMDPNLLKKLLASLNTSSADAKTAQNQQYSDLMGSVAGTKGEVNGAYNSASGLLAGQGASAHQSVADNLVHQNATSEQDLMNRGLGNTTIRSSVLRGNDTAAQKANQSIDEGVAGQQAGLLQNKAGALANLGQLNADSILSKHVEGPDMNAYLQLLQQLGGNAGQMGSALTGGAKSGGTIHSTGGGAGFSTLFG